MTGVKKEILRVLREAGEEFVSGQRLCQELGVTRQAIWKNIGKLRENGYQIESVPNKGYRLRSVPDRLYAPDLESRLPEDSICHRVEYHDILDSTNTRAKQLAEQGEPEGTLVVAEQQLAGKGRRGRRWSSRPGEGIWMTLLLRPGLKPAQASGITLVAALAVVGGIRRVCPAEPLIKWPNDIVLQGKKLCGILTEMSSEMDFIHYAVVGIGINVNHTDFPEELEGKATSLRIETGKEIGRQELIIAVITEFQRYYQRYLERGDLSGLLEEYNRYLANREQPVTVYYGMTEDENVTRQGIAKGIDAAGALLVEIDGVCERIVSGEVSVRGIYGYV